MSWLEDAAAWTARHFTITQPATDMAALLRASADALEDLGAIEILDVVFSIDADREPPEARVSVYYNVVDDDTPSVTP